MNKEDKIAKINEEIVALQQQKAELEKITIEDARIYKTRWGQEFVCSKSVNSEVTDFYTAYSCGCCDDSPLLFRFFAYKNGSKIYADPVDLCLGSKAETYDKDGDPIPGLFDNWKAILQKYNINPSIYKKIEKQWN